MEAGGFLRGSANGEASEKPAHRVTVSRSFYISGYEVTVEQLHRFVNATDYRTAAEREGGAWVYIESRWEEKTDASWKNAYFDQADVNPVVCVDWYDAVEYSNYLSRKEGLARLLRQFFPDRSARTVERLSPGRSGWQLALHDLVLAGGVSR